LERLAVWRPLSSLEWGGDYLDQRNDERLEKLVLHNRLKEVRTEHKLSQSQLAELVGVSRNTISSIETGQFNPTAKLALVLCIALDKKFEELFYFD
jgi:putative transcriptional regulator